MCFLSNVSPNLTKNNYKESITSFLRINFALGNVLVRFMIFFKYAIPPVRNPPENGFCFEIYPIYLENSEIKINLL